MHRVHFSPAERVIYDLIDEAAEEAVIRKHLEEMSDEDLERFVNKKDIKGRTVLVNAVRGKYCNLVEWLLVRSNEWMIGWLVD